MGTSQSTSLKSHLSSSYNIISTNVQSSTTYLRDKETQQQYILREMMTNEKHVYDRIVRDHQIRRNFNSNLFLIALAKFQALAFEHLCSEVFKVFAIWEFPSRTLHHQIRDRVQARNRKFQDKQIWSILTSSITALQFLQTQQIPHQSLSPQTILIDSKGLVKLTDPLCLKQVSNFETILRNRQIQSIYLSPEQCEDLIKGQKFHNPYKNTVWTLAIIILECCLLENMGCCYRQDRGVEFGKVGECVGRVGEMYGHELRGVLSAMLSPKAKDRPDWISLAQSISSLQKKPEDRNNDKKINTNKLSIISLQSRETAAQQKPATLPNNTARPIITKSHHPSVPHNDQNPILSQRNRDNGNVVKLGQFSSDHRRVNSPPQLDQLQLRLQNVPGIPRSVSPGPQITSTNTNKTTKISYPDHLNNNDRIFVMQQNKQLNPHMPRQTNSIPTTTNSDKNCVIVTNIIQGMNNAHRYQPRTSTQNNQNKSYPIKYNIPVKIQHNIHHIPIPSQQHQQQQQQQQQQHPHQQHQQQQQQNPHYQPVTHILPSQFVYEGQHIQHVSYSKSGSLFTDPALLASFAHLKTPFSTLDSKQEPIKINSTANLDKLSNGQILKSFNIEYKNTDSINTNPAVQNIENDQECNRNKDPQLAQNKQSEQIPNIQKSPPNNFTKLSQKAKTAQSYNPKTEQSLNRQDQIQIQNQNQINQQEQQNKKSTSFKNDHIVIVQHNADDEEHGEFVQETFQQGGSYQGYKYHNMRHGYGKFRYNNGGMYDGNWKCNKMEGFGSLYYESGELAYQGMWKEDQFQGKGKLFNQKPNMLQHPFKYENFDNVDEFWVYYEGDFAQDFKQGQGKLMLSNGEYLQGFFHEDMVEGQGIFHFNNGQQIKGTWKQNRLVVPSQ